mgnify:FL=1
MSVKQLSVFAENKSGSLYEITKILADADIDLRAFSVADTQSYGVLRLIVNDPRKAAFALSEAEKIVNVTDVIGVQIPDSKGGLAELLAEVTKKNIFIEYLYAFTAPSAGHAYVVMKVAADLSETEALLSADGFTLISADDIR